MKSEMDFREPKVVFDASKTAFASGSTSIPTSFMSTRHVTKDSALLKALYNEEQVRTNDLNDSTSESMNMMACLASIGRSSRGDLVMRAWPMLREDSDSCEADG